MPSDTDTDTVVSASTVPPPAAAAVTVTDRFDIPSAIEVCAPWVPPSASTDRSMVPAPVISMEAPLTVTPGAEPPTARASTSDITVSVLAVSVNVPDFDPVPAAMTRSNVSWPAGIE